MNDDRPERVADLVGALGSPVRAQVGATVESAVSGPVTDGWRPSAVPFRSGGDFTVGAEDELLLLDRGGGLADGRCEEVIARLDRGLLGEAGVAPEVFTSQIEFNTPVCPDAGNLVEHLARCRAALAAAGQAAIGTALHPGAGPGIGESARSPRYEAILAEFAGVFRTPTSAFQVHVGLPNEDSLVLAYRGLRNRLAVFRALAAGSPFWHGQDSGLASARGIITRSYPRVGVPPLVRSYQEYEDQVAAELWAAEAPDYTHVWWHIRPQPRYGTLEIRLMDGQCSLDVAAGLVALVQGLARHAVEHPSPVDLPSCVLAENDFRAIRYGLDARIVDIGGTMRPLRDVAGEAIGQARGALADDRLDSPLDALVWGMGGEQEYERHRRIHAAAGMPGLLRDLVRRTVGELCEMRLDNRKAAV
jgi:glutamate---cysteine ligase / carboxylate-amine ligase